VRGPVFCQLVLTACGCIVNCRMNYRLYCHILYDFCMSYNLSVNDIGCMCDEQNNTTCECFIRIY